MTQLRPQFSGRSSYRFQVSWLPQNHAQFWHTFEVHVTLQVDWDTAHRKQNGSAFNWKGTLLLRVCAYVSASMQHDTCCGLFSSPFASRKTGERQRKLYAWREMWLYYTSSGGNFVSGRTGCLGQVWLEHRRYPGQWGKRYQCWQRSWSGLGGHVAPLKASAAVLSTQMLNSA